MYAKYIVIFFLLGLSTLLSAQSADNIRINIKIYPSQVLAIATAKDSQNINHSTKDTYLGKSELKVSALYGSQIRLLNEKYKNGTQDEKSKDVSKCPRQSKMIYSKSSGVMDDTITTSHFSSDSKSSNAKCAIADNSKMLVYLIITQ